MTEDAQPWSSSMETGPSGESFLQKIFRRLSTTQCLKLGANEAAPVAVVAVQRYLSEQPEGGQPGSYSYDVTVTDGAFRAKCLLHATLNHLVHVNALRTGGDVTVTRWSLVYNERRLGRGYVCIEGVSCNEGGSAVLARVSRVHALPVLVARGVGPHGHAPLQLGRKHYLPLWNNDDPEGDLWSSGPPPSDTVLDVSKIALLSSLESSFRTSWKPLPLLVRIIHKSRLRYYGKFGLKIDFPYQAYYEVADQSGSMSLVLWNELCPDFYRRLDVGTVLLLQDYTLKQSYSHRSRPQMDHHRMKSFTSIEICLNPRKPASVITVVSPKKVQPDWGLPEVCYRFAARSELEKLAENSACDVIGLVTFVGRVERVRSKGNTVPEKFWTYRWVHAVDGTSDQPFILELFSSSQAEVFNQICPMTYLVCTQMRVRHVEGSQPFLTSSCETQMSITGLHKGRPYVGHPRVKAFIRWTKSLTDAAVQQGAAVGGHYSYPPPLQPPAQDQEAPGVAPLVSAADLKRELQTLQYREHKQVAVQGTITAAQYRNVQRAPNAPGPGETGELEVSEDGFSPPRTAERTPDPLVSSSDFSRRGQTPMNKAAKISPNCRSPAAKSRKFVPNLTDEGEGEEAQPEERGPLGGPAPPLSWESSDWARQRREVGEHLRGDGFHGDSVGRRFSAEEQSELLEWSGLQPGRWSPGQRAPGATGAEPLPPSPVAPGYFQLTILGINKQMAVDVAFFPIQRSDDPRAAGLRLDPHPGSLLSCLCSGFLSPLRDPGGHTGAPPPPPEVLATAGELEDTLLVCVLDLCRLGGNRVEILLNKVFKPTEVPLQ